MKDVNTGDMLAGEGLRWACKKKKKSTASPSDFVSRPPPEGATHSGEGASSFS